MQGLAQGPNDDTKGIKNKITKMEMVSLAAWRGGKETKYKQIKLKLP